MTRRQLQNGMTLIELMVAVGILAIIILAVGYIFTQTTNAVNLTNLVLDQNANMRAFDSQLRDDLRQLSRDGFLMIIGNEDANGKATGLPPLLMFTMAGRFESKTDTDPNTGKPVVTNEALAVYMPLNDGSGKGGALGRYVFLLTGAGAPPFKGLYAFNPPSLDKNNPATFNPLAAHDCLGESLADLTAQLTADDLPNPNPNKWKYTKFQSLVTYYIVPLLRNDYSRFSTTPQTLAEVRNLWPYAVGGTLAGPKAGDTPANYPMAIAFCDGKDQSNQVNAANKPLSWFTPYQAYYCDYIAKPAASPKRDNAPYLFIQSLSSLGGGTAVAACWTCNNKTIWPKALKLTLSLQDPAGRQAVPNTYELIVSLPQ